MGTAKEYQRKLDILKYFGQYFKISIMNISCNNRISVEHFSGPNVFDYFNDISHRNKYDFKNVFSNGS